MHVPKDALIFLVINPKTTSQTCTSEQAWRSEWICVSGHQLTKHGTQLVGMKCIVMHLAIRTRWFAEPGKMPGSWRDIVVQYTVVQGCTSTHVIGCAIIIISSQHCAQENCTNYCSQDRSFTGTSGSRFCWGNIQLPKLHCHLLAILCHMVCCCTALHLYHWMHVTLGVIRFQFHVDLVSKSTWKC